MIFIILLWFLIKIDPFEFEQSGLIYLIQIIQRVNLWI